ncbi:MAG: acetyl-coenzyme A synthetase N-terminal domain-containing protein, partial [Methanobacteriaceae archaeon]|nr:acetyl-coenzyme A synthetase N-terminal domain-containing protein [Methanobacteriaceae archaeon]
MSGKEDVSWESKKIFEPNPQVVKDSNIQVWMKLHQIQDYDELLEKAGQRPEWFWDQMAKELEWEKPYKKVLKWEAPHSEWFLDGKFNLVHNALDRHVQGP